MSKTHSDGDLLVFSEFIAYLREQGFSIGIHQYLRLYDLLSKVDKACDLSDLKTILCPILATSRSEQEQFYVAFDNFFGAFHALLDSESKESNVADSTSPPGENRFTYAWPSIHIAAQLLFVVFVFALALITRSDNRNTEPSSTTSIQVNQSPPSIAPPTESPSPKPSQPADTGSDRTRLNSSSRSPLFISQTYDLPISSPVASPSPTPTLSFWQRHGKQIRLIISLLPLIFLLSYEAYRFKQRVLILQKQRKKKPPYVWPIKVYAEAPKIYDSEQFYDTARLLRRRQIDEFSRLDIDATIAATVEAHGYPSPRYRPGSKPSEYLVLIDRASLRDHQAKLFDNLVGVLKNEQVFIERYFYEGDPRVCFSEDATTGIYLSDLQIKYVNHRLIIFGDGARLINPLTGDLESWVSLFQEWPERALLTPRSIQRWGLMEVGLVSHFILLPASLNGIRALTEYFAPPLMAYSLRLGQRETDISSDLRERSELIPALRKQLGEETFQWLCACAVYPELQWDLTLYLGALPCMPSGLINEENLLRLTRLPWFRLGSIPDELRYVLILELDKPTEKAIRSALIELLENNPPGESLANTYAADSYQLNLVVQRWLHRQSYKRFREVLKLIKRMPANPIYLDQTVIRFLESNSGSPLFLVLPERLRKLFYRDGIPAFGMRTPTRILTACALMAIAWFCVKPPKPPVPITPPQIRSQIIELCRPILFETSSYYLHEDARDCLYKIIDKLKENPDARLVIDGHASDLRSPKFDYNEELARSRTITIADYLRRYARTEFTIITRYFGSKCNASVASLFKQARVEIWMLLGEATVSDIDNLKKCDSPANPVNTSVFYRPDTSQKHRIYSAEFSPDEKTIVTASADGTARVLDDKASQSLLILRGHTGWVYNAKFSPDGKQIVTVSVDGTARLWEARTGQPMFILQGHTGWVYNAEFSPNGRMIVTASADGTARVWDAETGRGLAVLKGYAGDIYSATFSRNGRFIVIAGWDNTARVWDSVTGQSLVTLYGHIGNVYSAEFSPDEKTIVTASADGTARVWDAETGRSLSVLKGQAGGVYSAKFSPDGTLIVTAGADGTARLWEARTGQPMFILQGHTGWVYNAEFSPNGRMIVTASADGTARVWDVITGRNLHTFEHTGDVHTAKFSPNGRFILTASADGTARIWLL